MLELLARYARDHKLVTEPGFAPKDVRWAICCDTDGKFKDVVELGDPSLGRRNRGQQFSCCPDFSQPEMVAGGVTKSHFLVDTLEVVALAGDKAAEKKTAAKHDYFISLLREAAKVMPELAKVAGLLADAPSLAATKKRLDGLGAKPNEKATFRIKDGYPVESDRWHDWWRTFRKSLARDASAADDAGRMRCYVSGDVVQPLATHPKVKGLAGVGGMATGDVLVGFDKDAFRSFGLEQSANAAMSEPAAATYAAAINDLIRNHGRELAGAIVVHWFKAHVKPEDDPLAWLEDPPKTEERNAQHRAQELLDSIRSGKRPDVSGNQYFALTLSGAKGRVMVRDWMEGKFEELVANVGHWFDDLSIVHREGGRAAPDPKFLAVLGATVREPKDLPAPSVPEHVVKTRPFRVRELKDLPAPFVSKVWRVATRGEPIPQAALAQAFARFKVDILDKHKTFNHARMGLMKAYHVRRARSERKQEDLMPYLNEEHPSPAYHCGRLMAVLAQLQRAALGDVGAGVVQRYYAAASATPALVLGRLIRGGQFHLNKLEPGLAHWYEQRLGEISGRIGGSVPATLTLEEQSLFALGYYQQSADMRTKKSDDAKKEA
jgi:CRISPR-associated protein Csd1